MSKLSLQELFTNAVIGLASQGWQQSGIFDADCYNNVRCKYRGPNGLRCAIGWSIKDEDYRAEMDDENMACSILLMRYPSALQVDMEAEARMRELQNAHDKSITPETMKKAMQDFGAKYNLKWPESVGV